LISALPKHLQAFAALSSAMFGAITGTAVLALLGSLASADLPPLMARAQPQQEVVLAVIGQSGVGKSSIQTAWARSDNIGPRPAKPIFPECAGAGSCTQRVMRKSFDQLLGDRPVKLTLIDTMGFPDPNRTKAVEYYDKVVEAVSDPINAVIWVLKCDRQLASDMQKYTTMMEEFQSLKVPLIMLMNNRGNYVIDDDDEDDRRDADRRREADRKQCSEDALFIQDEVGVRASGVIVSAERKEFSGRVKVEMARLLSHTTPKTSQLRTMSQLKSSLEAVTTELGLHEEALRRQRVNLDNVARNIAFQEGRRNEFHTVTKHRDVEHVQHNKKGHVEKRWKSTHAYSDTARKYSDEAINGEVAKLQSEKTSASVELANCQHKREYASSMLAGIRNKYAAMRRMLEL